MTTEGAIFLGEEPVLTRPTCRRSSPTSASTAPRTRVYVRGDLAANYGAVMQVMGALSGAGYAKIGLITEQAQQAPAP